MKKKRGISFVIVLSLLINVMYITPTIAASNPPTVVTENAANITENSATLNGEITANGGELITEYGFCWGTNAGNPQQKVIISTSNYKGSISTDISGLSPGSTYYFYSYAKNKAGKGTGNVLHFTTKQEKILVTRITLNKTELILTEGGNPVKLTATVSPSNATNPEITWSTNKSAVATVDDSGVVTPNAAGTCIITAMADDGSRTYSQCSITVNAPETTPPPPEITLPAPTITYPLNEQSLVKGDMTITWNSVPGADYYLIAIRDETSGDKIINNDQTTNTSYTLFSSLLTEGHRYRVAIGAYDNKGNCRWNDPYTYFSINGQPQPQPQLTIIGTSPPDYGTGMNLNDTITLTFSDNIQIMKNTIKVINTTNNLEAYITCTTDGNRLYITRGDHDKWSSGTTYTVIIPHDAVANTSGNSLADDYTFHFTTMVQISTEKPVITISNPKDGQRVVKGTMITIKASAAANNPISGMGLYVDSSDKTMTYYTNSFEFNWDTNTTYIGEHKIKVTAVDSNGNTGEKEVTLFITSDAASVQIPSTVIAEVAKSTNTLEGTISSKDGQTITDLEIAMYKDSGEKITTLMYKPYSSTFDLSRVNIDTTKEPFDEPGISPYKSRDYRYNILVSYDGANFSRINERNYILRVACPYKISDTGTAGLYFQESIQPLLLKNTDIKNMNGNWNTVSNVTWIVDDPNIAAVINNTLVKVSTGDTVLRAYVNGVEVARSDVHIKKQIAPVVSFSEFNLVNNDLHVKLLITNKGNTAPLKNVSYQWELVLNGKQIAAADWSILTTSLDMDNKIEQEKVFKVVVTALNGVLEYRVHVKCDDVKEVIYYEHMDLNKKAAEITKERAAEIEKKVKDNYEVLVKKAVEATVNGESYHLLLVDSQKSKELLGQDLGPQAWIFTDINGDLVQDPDIIKELQVIRYANILLSSEKGSNWANSITDMINDQEKLSNEWKLIQAYDNAVQTIWADTALYYTGIGLAELASENAKNILKDTVSQIKDVDTLLSAYIWWFVKLQEDLALKASWYNGYDRIATVEDAEKFIRYMYAGYDITPCLVLYQKLLKIPETKIDYLYNHFKGIADKIVDMRLNTGYNGYYGTKSIQDLNKMYNALEITNKIKTSIDNVQDVLDTFDGFKDFDELKAELYNSAQSLNRAVNPDYKESINYKLLTTPKTMNK